MRRRDSLFWVTQDGTRVPIEDLDDRHLKNIVLMLRRRAAELLASDRDACQSIIDTTTETGLAFAIDERDRMCAVTVDEYAAAAFKQDPHGPYASYEDLRNAAIERRLLGVFGTNVRAA